MNKLEYLYHYTTIDTLALILKNHTIRFNSLDKMDDLQEQQTADIKNIGQFCYISSWTDDATESIPMWNMYASLNRGVRIKLRKNPFKVYKNKSSDIANSLNAKILDSNKDTFIPSIIPLAEMFEGKFVSPQALGQNILHKVAYTDDNEKLYPHLLEENGTQFTISLGNLGIYKNLHWAFQNEWRYILNIFPLNLSQPPEKSLYDFQFIANQIRLGLARQAIPYYDMVIADEYFKEMEIILSPRLSAGNKIIAYSLIEKYNPTAKLSESCLAGLL